MTDKYFIWWTSQADCQRIAPLETWPVWLYEEFRNRMGRSGRGRLWISNKIEAPDIPQEAAWSSDNWLCVAVEHASAAGIVIRAEDLRHVQFLPGFVTTFAMGLPETGAAL